MNTTAHAYNPESYKIATQITGRETQAIHNRFQKVAVGDHDYYTSEDLAHLIQVASGYQDWGTFWDVLNRSDRGDEEMLNLLHYIVGDSW